MLKNGKILESAWLQYNSLHEHSIGVSYAYEIGIGIRNLLSLVSGCRKVKPKIVLVYIKNINIIAQQTNNNTNKKKMVSRNSSQDQIVP